MELIKSIIEFILHIDRHLDVLIKSFGNWTYLLLFLIIFCETGLVVTPFLPGDSLLFVLGAFSAVGFFNLTWIFIILISAAIIGDSVNYAFGKLFGERLLAKGDHRFFKREHVDRTHKFYERHGGKTIILARFVPIVRTFAPFVAGIGKMSYLKFLVYNVVGGILWVFVFVLAGYFFGNVPIVKDNFMIVIFAMMFISLLPVITELWKNSKRKKANC